MEIKVELTKRAIREFYEYFQGDVYISFSGGKDSTVLLDIARQEIPEIKACYIDTGLEYPEVREFVHTIDNVDIIRPKMSFKQILDKYGYPVISKEQSQYIYQYKTAKSQKTKDTRWNGNRWGQGKISEKWKYLVDAPFKISDKCCDVMKKNPAKQYEKETGLHPIIGTMACESSHRAVNWGKYGCNAFDLKRPTSRPMSFWTEQDVLSYIKKNNIPYSDAYGDIATNEETGYLYCTKAKRTGCMFCLYGVQHDDEPNRFQRMKETHPKMYDYCMNKLEIKEILEYIKVPYK